jgi:hypothetical protein
MSGTLNVGSGGTIELKEEDGLDYQATTVQLPGGERVPFLFTIKELVAKGKADGFGGEFTVPSYRGATFLDPKGRGGATGYDNAVALPARSDAEELLKENLKSTVALKGAALLLNCFVCSVRSLRPLVVLPTFSCVCCLGMLMVLPSNNPMNYEALQGDEPMNAAAMHRCLQFCFQAKCSSL